MVMMLPVLYTYHQFTSICGNWDIWKITGIVRPKVHGEHEFIVAVLPKLK